ncbi:MAG: tRNA adenosine(34) deaminase TadA [Desulfobacteraceae bacterium]|nr:tRNA adenosine(34) deaminase TadA [Desulfobacteraceae bacterium]
MKSDFFFMGLALEEAKKAYGLSEVPVGAVLVSDSLEILSAAHNMPILSGDPTAHAEILAIRSAACGTGNYRLPESILYVTLEPCAMCVGAMLQARVRRLVFGARDPRSGAAGSVVDLTQVASFNHSIEVTGDVRAEECADILRRFFRERRADRTRI